MSLTRSLGKEEIMNQNQNQEAMRRWMQYMAGERDYVMSMYHAPDEFANHVPLHPPSRGEGESWTLFDKQINGKWVYVTWCRNVMVK